MRERLTYRQAVARAQRSLKFQSWKLRRVVAKSTSAAEEILTGIKARHEEKHYSPSELAKMWGLGDDTIREIFKNEPGVLSYGNAGTRTRRRYITMRIPESVVIRVHNRLSAKAQPVRKALPC
jgi:hypothetical protein